MDEFNLETSHPLARYRTHLEFNGYRVEENEEEIVCRHPRKPNLCARQVTDRGVLISTVYTFQDMVGRREVLEYLNSLNSEFIFLKAFVDEENNLILETFFEGEYDRTNFSILLDNIEYDMNVLAQHELTEAYLQ